MAIEHINIGLTANDCTGDTLRDAFIKINNNYDYVTSPIELTFDELLALSASASLDPNHKYIITDYRTINEAGFDVINYGDVEPLMVTAYNEYELYKEAVSTLRKDDIIYYDLNDNVITDQIGGEYQDGESDGDITFSDFTTYSFTVDVDIYSNGGFYLFMEDGDNDMDTDEDGLGTVYTIDGNTITLINPVVDLLSQDLYIELEVEYIKEHTKGKITYRKDIKKNISAVFDFISTKYARKKADISTIPTWDSSVTYSKDDKVVYNDDMYVSLIDNNSSNYPSYGYKWIRTFVDVEWSYYFDENSVIYNPILLDDIKLMPIFSYLDYDTKEVIFSLENYKNIEINSENNIFSMYRSYYSCNNVIIGNRSSNNSLYGIFNDVYFGDNYTYNIISYDSSMRGVKFNKSTNNSVFSKYIQYSNFTKLYKCVLNDISNSDINGYLYASNLRYLQYSTIGINNRYINIDYSIYLNMGDYNNTLYIYKSDYCTFGDYNSFLNITSAYFSLNNIGNYNRYWNISATSFKYNRIGNYNGNAKEYQNISHTIYFMKIGDFNFAQGSLVVNSGMYSVELGNYCDFIKIDYAKDLKISNYISYVDLHNVYNTTIDGASRDIHFDNVLLYDSIINNCEFLNCDMAYFRNNIVRGVQNFTFNNVSSTQNAQLYHQCDIFDKPDGTPVLRFVDDDDIQYIVDPND